MAAMYNQEMILTSSMLSVLIEPEVMRQGWVRGAECDAQLAPRVLQEIVLRVCFQLQSLPFFFATRAQELP